MSQSIIAIQNPGEEPEVFQPYYLVDIHEIIDRYGDKLQLGAFVTIIDLDDDGDVDGEAGLYIVDRGGNFVYLQSNDRMSNEDEDERPNVDDIGAVVCSGCAALATPAAPVNLTTFTAFGTNDDGEKFVAVFSADGDNPEAIQAAAVHAGTADEGCEHLVTVALIAQGDQTANLPLEAVTLV